MAILKYYNVETGQWVRLVDGIQGATGPQGGIGVTGATGLQGVQGNIGATGPQGLIGVTGATGPQGEVGVTGFTGATGPQGLQGVQGEQGLVGEIGAQGATGPIGATGPQGVHGNTGATGPQGNVGVTGATGPQGNVGVTGATGPQGNVGVTGATGPQGNVGVTGATGPQGVQGVPGEVGAPFAITKIYASLSALLTDTAPTGIAAGQFAIINTGDVNNSDNSKLYLWTGTEYSYVTDLSGAEGVQGPQGIQGVQGSVGPQGVTGVTGATGPQGISGIAGSVGVTGATGPQGNVGVTGATGPQGNVGVTGATGPQGNVGVTGATGPQGVTGTTGDKGGVRYTFSSTTTDADPGNGALRYNNATVASVTQLFIDNVDAAGVAQTLWYSAWDDSTTTSTRGFIQVTGNVAGSTVVNIFRITGAVTAATGYYKIPVSYVSGSIPANATAVVVDFSRTGDIGVTGATGPQGATGVANYNNPQFTGTASFGGPIQEGYVNGGNTGTAKTIALTSGTLQNFTLTGNCTFTMPTAVAGQSFTVLLRTGTTGGFTATFTGVKWPDNTAPTVTTTANRLDLFVFVSDGTIWYGSVLQGYAP